MKILYYYWGEITKEDCVECMLELGWQADVWSVPMKDLTEDHDFKEKLRARLKQKYDCVFSFDYFPLISETASDMGVPYVSWIYDSPHLTLQSKTLGNPFNRVCLFDYGLACRYRDEGFDNVDYVPLACNVRRLEKICGGNRNKSDHDVTFLGNLYSDQNDFYARIGYLPEYLRGYLDALMLAQEQLYGIDLPSEMISDELCAEISKYVRAELGDAYRPSGNEIFRNMVRKKITVNERKNILKALGSRFNVDLYSQQKPPADVHVRYMGYADYLDAMPRIFASSRINLNVSLRSILTGIPLRVIDVLGAGGFVMSNYQTEFSEYFVNGQDIVWYDSVENLIDKTAYYLQHDDERNRIADAGHVKACELFTYERLLPCVMDGIG